MTQELRVAERIASSDHWREQLDEPDTVYATWEWGTICEEFGHDRYYLGIEDDGQLVAGIPLMYVGNRLFGRELVSMPYAPYGGVLLAEDASNPEHYRAELLSDVRRLSDSLGVSQTTIRGYDTGIDDEGFRQSSRFVTFERDLTGGEDAVWDAVSSRFRRSVRKARKEDVRVVRGFDDTTFREYYRLYLDNMRYYGTPPYSRAFFRNVNDHLGARDAFEMYLAYDDDGRPINGVTAFFFGDRAIYWTGVSDYEHRSLNGGSLLLWEAIVDSCNRGFSVFDLGRTRENTGVYDYKNGIGDPVDLVDVHYAPDGDLDLLDPEDESYETYKRLWRKLPLKATEYLGPRVRKRVSL